MCKNPILLFLIFRVHASEREYVKLNNGFFVDMSVKKNFSKKNSKQNWKVVSKLAKPKNKLSSAGYGF